MQTLVQILKRYCEESQVRAAESSENSSPPVSAPPVVPLKTKAKPPPSRQGARLKKERFDEA